MKHITLTIGLVSILVLTGFDWPWSLEGKMEGDWRMGSREYKLRGGTMAILHTSIVFATYKSLDKGSILFTRTSSDSKQERIVIVTFPSSETMAWSLESGGQTNLWWAFERIKD